MKLMKKALVLGMAIMIATSLVACSSSTEQTAQTVLADDAVIATVNGVEITNEVVNVEMEYAKQMAMAIFGEDYEENEEAQEFLKNQRKTIINFLVEEEIITQQLKNFDINVTEEAVQEEFDNVKKDFETEEDFQKALETSNLDEDDLKENIRKSFEVQAMVDELTKDVAADDSEIKTYYDENIESFTTGAGAEMFHILVETEEEAKKVREEYVAGTSFGELAAKYGTDGTKDVEGALGFVEYDDQGYDADFLAGAKDLKEGEVSEPVKTQFGYHLIKVENIELEEKVTPLEEVKEEIKVMLEDQEKNAILDAKMTEWKEASDIVIAE